MLASISIKTRLGALVVLSAGLLATVAATGLAGMFALDRNIADLIDRQIRPAQQLATIQDLMRADVELLLRISQLDPRLNEGRSVAADVLEDYADEMASNGDFVELLWARYAERVAGDTERRLASDFLEARKALLEQGQTLVLSHFRSGAFADGNTALSRQLLPRFENAADALNALMLYKTETADQTYASVQARLRRDMLAILIVVVGGLLLAGSLGVMVTRAIVRPAKRALEVFSAIGNDRLDSQIQVSSNDEMGRILAGLHDMQARLRNRLLTERDEAAQARRISDALDAVTDAILVTDADRHIIHLNPAARMLFKRHQATFRKFLPEFAPDQLPGADMALFQRLPGAREALADEPAGCQQARLQLGEVYLAVTVTPIHDDAGGRLGTVVQWLDESAEVAAEQALEGLVQAATRGDFSRRMEVSAGSGFFRRLGEQLNLLIGTTEASLREVSRVLGALAEGDLTERVTGDFAGAFGDLQHATNHSIEQLEILIGQVHEAVDAIASAARQISAGHANLSHRTEEQAASLEETASSMEEMTSTVRQNAAHASQANQLAQGACQVADHGGLKVREVVSSMSRIADSARRIENIVAVIDGIAFQTNILALNAAVEAARAGEQGRGFAVVAGEVRTLAQRSAEAAREIKALIAASVESVASGNTLAGQAGQTMDDIVSAIKGVTDIMSEISAASAEQSQGIDQVSVTVSQLDEMTQQNAALVEEATAAAGMLQEQAERLTVAVSAFQSSRRSPTRPSARNEHLPVLPPRMAQRGQTPTANTRPGSPSPVNRFRLDSDAVDEQEWVEF